MTNRRDFIKTTLAVASGATLSQIPTAFASGTSWPSNIVYTEKDPGQWAEKVGGHAPKVTVKDNKVTITTKHVMVEKHYIVRHTLVSEDGKVLGAKTFSSDDEAAVSTFDLPAEHSAKLYATSFCNKHDLWVTEFTI